MASKAAVQKNDRRRRLVERYREQRNDLRKMVRNQNLDPEQRMEAARQLALLPRNSNPIRVRNRCNMTGRPRGYLRFFGLSRIAMRELALKGELPGVRKASL